MLSGLLRAGAEPLKLYRSRSFWAKMGLIALLGVHASALPNRVYEITSKLDIGLTPQANLAASLSLILWAEALVTGRLIAFDS